jgi:hypothetical protein
VPFAPGKTVEVNNIFSLKTLVKTTVQRMLQQSTLTASTAKDSPSKSWLNCQMSRLASSQA